MHTQVINLRLVTSHEVAGSEAELSPHHLTKMTNMPYLIQEKSRVFYEKSG